MRKSCMCGAMKTVSLLFDQPTYVHGKQLVSCPDRQLLNHTVPGQVSRRQLTIVLCPFFWPVTDNLLFLNKHKR